jgi:hypothetical protein
MPHCTPEQLTLAALREPIPSESAAHLSSCAVCAAELASLRRSVDAVAVPQLAAPDRSISPPPHVWEAIAAATGVPVDAGSPEDDGLTADAVVLPLRSRRRPLLLVAASLVIGAVVGAGAVAVLRGGAEDASPVETAALDPLGGNQASGTAEVVVGKDGSRALEVTLDAPTPSQGYYEVWLTEPSTTDMFSLGIAHSGTQTLQLPADLDLHAYPIVDVSLEPLDGNPLHSSVSVARGQLES